jgi:hypothetical protein
LRSAGLLVALGLAQCAGVLAGLPSAARAAEGLYLTWDACAFEPAASPVKVFACSTDSDTLQLHVGFTLGQPVDNVIGLEVVVDIQHESATLPDWWRLDAAGCRAGALRSDARFGAVAGCADPWAGEGVAGFPSYTVTQPRGGANQARIKAGIGVLPSAPRSLAADTPYHAIRLVLIADKASGIGACVGCDQKACMVLNSIWIKRTPGAPGGDVFVSTPGPLEANWATWQGAGANCSLVPVRRQTWGAVKSFYR